MCVTGWFRKQWAQVILPTQPDTSGRMGGECVAATIASVHAACIACDRDTVTRVHRPHDELAEQLHELLGSLLRSERGQPRQRVYG